MQRCTLTIKNFRCFEDTSPVVVEIGDGFTALVGQNNSGKSSFLRLFFELRPHWNTLAANLHGALQSGQFGVGCNGVIDQEEIFCNKN